MRTKLVLLIVCVSNYSYATDQFKKKIFNSPIREVSIIATRDGFYPNKLVAYKGEKLKVFITSTTEKPQCFILQKHEVFISADKGRVNEGEVVLDRAGRFKFFCPANKSYGHLTVFDNTVHTDKEEVKRDIASKAPTFWMPRDYD